MTINHSNSIDLNADIGEGMPYDSDILNHVSSCNIACGGHAGDDVSILKTIKLAQENKVKIGAHPSYRDTQNFGRTSLNISIESLIDTIDYQLSLFKNCIEKVEANWHHIKFHGALYNDLKHNNNIAKALVDLIKDKYKSIALYVPPNSVIKNMAENQIPIFVEGFADRAYTEDLSLVSRLKPNAVLSNEKKVVQQILNMIIDKKVKAVSGQQISIQVDTICLHGDNPKALILTEKIVSALKKSNINIQ